MVQHRLGAAGAPAEQMLQALPSCAKDPGCGLRHLAAGRAAVALEVCAAGGGLRQLRKGGGDPTGCGSSAEPGKADTLSGCRRHQTRVWELHFPRSA